MNDGVAMKKLVSILCGLLFGGCNTTTPPTETATPEPPIVHEGIIPDGPRGQILADNITAWGREHVGTGDDTLVTWSILSARDENHLSYVEVAPEPDEVGYDKFVFVISFADEEPNLIATYCFEDGKFLMFSSNAEMEEDLPDELDW